MFLDAEGESTATSKFLTGKKLYLTGLEHFPEKELVRNNQIVKAGGEVVSCEHNGPIDYLVTGLIYDVNKEISMEPDNIWTYLWLEDCLEQGKIAPLQYFHQPIIPPEPDIKPCQDLVIGISNYKGFERQYIRALAQALGMTAQELFARKNKKGALKNTHLICKIPEGTKYEAGLNWQIPVVSHSWLLNCLKYKTFVSEKTFLVGNSTVVTPNKPDVDELEKKLETAKNHENQGLIQFFGKTMKHHSYELVRPCIF